MSLDERSDELDRKMAEHPATEAIEVLTKDARRRKRQLRILAVVVVINLLLIGGFGYVLYRVNQTAHLAQSNKQAVVDNCEVSNESRKNQRIIWDFVFSIPPEQPPTAKQTQRAADFKKLIEKTFAQRNCQAEIKRS